MKSNKKVLIIGAGIHGSFLAKYLIEKKIQVYLVEKNKEICLGSSNATHNRANRGFHYPRSRKTTLECKKGYEFFVNNYKRFLKQTNSFYCIEKKSKVSLKNYVNFFKKNKLKIKIIKNNHFIKNEYLEGIVQGEEGCYNHYEIKKYLKRKLKSNYLKRYFNFHLKKVSYQKNLIRLKDKKGRNINQKFDFVINATYDNSNMISNLFGVRSSYKYKHQFTEVVCVKSKRKFPGITIMDGPYATIMPHVGKKNEYLLYDVTNSILKKSNKPININNPKTNFKKIKKKLSRYINYTNDLKYIKSFYGKRPVPIKDNTADRSTKILKEILKNKTNFISIKEGKYISAPYIAKEISKKIIFS